jgi:hypothetical protein
MAHFFAQCEIKPTVSLQGTNIVAILVCCLFNFHYLKYVLIPVCFCILK